MVHGQSHDLKIVGTQTRTPNLHLVVHIRPFLQNNQLFILSKELLWTRLSALCLGRGVNSVSQYVLRGKSNQPVEK